MPAEISDDHQGLLLPAPIRGAARLWAGACAVVFLALAVRYFHTAAPGAFDSWAVSHLPGRGIPRAVLRPGTDAIPVLLGATAAVGWFAVRTWQYAALAVGGPGATLLVVELGKLVIGRRLDGVLSLPSGHTAIVTSLALVGALLLVDRLRARAVLAATVGIVGVTLVAGGMAYVLVLLDWHYATDTIAGYCVAIAVTLGLALAIDRSAGRQSRIHAGSRASGAWTSAPQGAE